MENRIAAGTLTDIGTEELAHLEMVATIICQLTKNLTPVSYTHLDVYKRQ